MAKFNDRDYTLKALKKQLLATELHFRDGSYKDCTCTLTKHLPTISELSSEGVGFTKDQKEKDFMERVRDQAETYAEIMGKPEFTKQKADEVREWARDTRRRIDFQKFEGEIPKTAAKDEECSTCKPLFAQKEVKHVPSWTDPKNREGSGPMRESPEITWEVLDAFAEKYPQAKKDALSVVIHNYMRYTRSGNPKKPKKKSRKPTIDSIKQKFRETATEYSPEEIAGWHEMGKTATIWQSGGIDSGVSVQQKSEDSPFIAISEGRQVGEFNSLEEAQEAALSAKVHEPSNLSNTVAPSDSGSTPGFEVVVDMGKPYSEKFATAEEVEKYLSDFYNEHVKGKEEEIGPLDINIYENEKDITESQAMREMFANIIEPAEKAPPVKRPRRTVHAKSTPSVTLEVPQLLRKEGRLSKLQKRLMQPRKAFDRFRQE